MSKLAEHMANVSRGASVPSSSMTLRGTLAYLKSLYPVQILDSTSSDARLREYFGQQQVIRSLERAIEEYDRVEASPTTRTSYV